MVLRTGRDRTQRNLAGSIPIIGSFPKSQPVAVSISPKHNKQQLDEDPDTRLHHRVSKCGSIQSTNAEKRCPYKGLYPTASVLVRRLSFISDSQRLKKVDEAELSIPRRPRGLEKSHC